MNLESEILSLWIKDLLSRQIKMVNNYAGISILFDVSSDAENATKFITKIDGQISGFMTILSAALPGAVTKEKSEINRLHLIL